MAKSHSRYSLCDNDMKNSTIPTVKKVLAQQDYCLEVFFSNGEHGILNMRPYLDFGVFRRLQNTEAFRQVKVSFNTVEWASGADLDPEFVYRKTRKCSTQHPS